ncbi:AraC family transcriptional regulator [Afipia sp. TerB]
MLANGQVTVSEAAYRVGYSPAHFATIFRQRFNVSPSKLRPRLHSNQTRPKLKRKRVVRCRKLLLRWNPPRPNPGERLNQANSIRARNARPSV